MGDDQRDVFISYGHPDAEWVRTLARNLYQSGLEVFFDEWDIAPGDVLVHRIDAGILAGRSGILVVSPTAQTRPYVQAEYAALMGRAIERGQRLIPVLLKDAEMPPLLASRIWVDFRNADGSDYLARVGELVRALKGERGGPTTRTGACRPGAASGPPVPSPFSSRSGRGAPRCPATASRSPARRHGPTSISAICALAVAARASPLGAAARRRRCGGGAGRAGERIAGAGRQAGGRLSAARGGGGAGVVGGQTAAVEPGDHFFPGNR